MNLRKEARKMARKPVFLSFCYNDDVFRVQQIRNMDNIIEGQPLLSTNDFETIKKQGEKAIKNWIDNETKLYIYERETEFDLLWNNQNTDGFVFIEEANKLLKKEFIKYSKGRLIVENELELSDTLILYYENSKFQIKNNLLSEINENSRPISKIKKKFLENNNLWYFKDNIDYKQAEKLIEYFNRYAKREKIKFYISRIVKLS